MAQNETLLMRKDDREMFLSTAAMTCVHGRLPNSEAGPIIPQLDMIKLAQDLSHVVSQKMVKKIQVTTTQKKLRRIIRDLKRVHQKNNVRSSNAMNMDELLEDELEDGLDEDMETAEEEPPEADTAFIETMDAQDNDETSFMDHTNIEKDDDSDSDVEDDLDEDDQGPASSGMTGPLSFKPCLSTLVSSSGDVDSTFNTLASLLEKEGFDF